MKSLAASVSVKTQAALEDHIHSVGRRDGRLAVRPGPVNQKQTGMERKTNAQQTFKDINEASVSFSSSGRRNSNSR